MEFLFKIGILLLFVQCFQIGFVKMAVHIVKWHTTRGCDLLKIYKKSIKTDPELPIQLSCQGAKLRLLKFAYVWQDGDNSQATSDAVLVIKSIGGRVTHKYLFKVAWFKIVKNTLKFEQFEHFADIESDNFRDHQLPELLKKWFGGVRGPPSVSSGDLPVSSDLSSDSPSGPTLPIDSLSGPSAQHSLPSTPPMSNGMPSRPSLPDDPSRGPSSPLYPNSGCEASDEPQIP